MAQQSKTCALWQGGILSKNSVDKIHQLPKNYKQEEKYEQQIKKQNTVDC